jgi:hypothetical protein
MGALRRYKDLNTRYQLELLQGARSINQTSEQETLWGVPCVQTTQQAAGRGSAVGAIRCSGGLCERSVNHIF